MLYSAKPPFNAEIRLDYKNRKAEFNYPQDSAFDNEKSYRHHLRLAWFIAPYARVVSLVFYIFFLIIAYMYFKDPSSTWNMANIFKDIILGYNMSPKQIMLFSAFWLIMFYIIIGILEIAFFVFFGYISIILNENIAWVRDRYALWNGAISRPFRSKITIDISKQFGKNYVIDGTHLWITKFRVEECEIHMSTELWEHLNVISTHCYDKQNNIATTKFAMLLDFDKPLKELNGIVVLK